MNPDLRQFLEPPRITNIFRLKTLRWLLAVLLVVLVLPWSMYTSGEGQLTAVDPNERIQEVNATVGGLVRNWHVREGSVVKKGDSLVDLVDTDDDYLSRVEAERRAARDALAAAETALNTGRINEERQRRLMLEGLSARKDYEKAKIEVANLLSKVSEARATLLQAETQSSRQTRQRIEAPRDGVVVRILKGAGNQVIKTGDPLLVFAPVVSRPAVELYVNGDDMRFVHRGDTVRVQIEGWPVVQVPGWPSIAIGTFGARVLLVDQATTLDGRFRVLVEPVGNNWPRADSLRLNANARGFIYLGNTIVAFELWRKLNKFPPKRGSLGTEAERLLGAPGN